jgi:cysteinyl-tRNA synthetase
MSKSLGNFLTVRDALELADRNVWRLLFLMTHPRSPLDYSSTRLQQSKNSWTRLLNVLADVEPPADEAAALTAEAYTSEAARAFLQKFNAALSDDLNTPDALAVAFDAVSDFHRGHDAELAQALRAGLQLLGFTFEAQSAGDELTPQLLDLLVEVRNDARERRDFKGSDLVRDKLKALGIVLEDTPQGTKWKIER